jgi:hypothetical protein
MRCAGSARRNGDSLLRSQTRKQDDDWQRAMAVAMMYPEPRSAPSSSGKPEDVSKGYWQNLLSMARTVSAAFTKRKAGQRPQPR